MMADANPSCVCCDPGEKCRGFCQPVPKTCSHGKTFDERCIGCEIVLAREGERWAGENWAKYRDLVARLTAEQDALIRG